MVEAEGVSIDIPGGAVTTIQEIAIIEIADDGGFGENTISESFKIKGLPNTHSKSVQMCNQC